MYFFGGQVERMNRTIEDAAVTCRMATAGMSSKNAS